MTATVQVAAIYSVGLGDMGQYVERFAAEQPFARVHVEYLHPNRVVEKVRDGSADLGLVSFPRKTRNLVVLPWREEEMVLACQPSHPLARQMSVRPAQLAGEKYVAFDKELGIRRQVDRFLREHGVDGGGGVGVRQHREHQERHRNRRRRGPAAGADAAAGSAGGLARCPAAERLPLRAAAGHHPPAPEGSSPAAQRFIDLLLENGSTEARHQHNGTAHDRRDAVPPQRNRETPVLMGHRKKEEMT